MKFPVLLLLSISCCLGQPGGGFISAPQVLQKGLLLEYRFDEGSGNVAHNRANPLPTSYTNFTSYFDPALWSLTGGSANGTTDPTGGTNAVRVSQTGLGSLFMLSTSATSLPAGTYTMSCYLLATNNVPQTVRFYNVSGFGPDLTVSTNGWTLQSWTFTNASPIANFNPQLRNGSAATGSTPYDLLFYGLKVEPGQSASPYTLPRGDLSLGKVILPDAFDPVWSSQGLNFTNTASLTAGTHFTPVTNNRVSIYAVVRSGYSNYSGSQIYPIMTSLWADNNWGLFLQKQHPANLGSGMGWNLGAGDCIMTAVQPYDGIYHMVGVTFDGATVMSYFDDAPSGFFTDTLPGAMTFKNAFLNGYGNIAAYSTNWSIAYFSLYTAPHSAADAIYQFRAIKNLMARKGVVLPAQRKSLLCFEGDSIVRGYYANPMAQLGYSSLIASNLNVQAATLASGGATMAKLIARADRLDSLLAGRTNGVLFIGEGVNDINSLGTNAWYSAFTNYCAARKAAGWTVVVSTVMPGTIITSANRNAVNAKIRTDYTQYASRLADFATNVFMGCDACNQTNTYWHTDQLHPNTVGHALLAPIAQAEIQPIFP